MESMRGNPVDTVQLFSSILVIIVYLINNDAMQHGRVVQERLQTKEYYLLVLDLVAIY